MFLGKWIVLDNSSDLWVTPAAAARRRGAGDEFVTDMRGRGKRERAWWRTVTLMERSNSFGWMKLFISFQVVIMSSCMTAMCRSFGWMFAPRWLVGNLHDLSPEVVWFTGQAEGERDVRRCTDEHGEEYVPEWKRGIGGGGVRGWVRCNYVSPQWQVWITNFNSRAMKMIWSGLNCKETATGMVMKICWGDVLCRRIHQTCPVRWKASVIHSVG